jgi:hypothetical protein
MNWPSMTASRKGGSGSTIYGVMGAGRECILRESVL